MDNCVALTRLMTSGVSVRWRERRVLCPCKVPGLSWLKELMAPTLDLPLAVPRGWSNGNVPLPHLSIRRIWPSCCFRGLKPGRPRRLIRVRPKKLTSGRNLKAVAIPGFTAPSKPDNAGCFI
jgi:hypothetical protein